MEEKHEIQSIDVMKAEELDEKTQRDLGVYTGFVEVKVERSDNPKPKIVPLSIPPALKLREEFHRAGIKKV